MIKSFMILLIATMSFVNSYGQGRPATDTELRAAYCVEYYNIVIPMISPKKDENLSKEDHDRITKILKEFNEKRDRLRRYVIGGMATMDGFDIAVAAKQAKYDFVTKLPECMKSCTYEYKSEWDKCFDPNIGYAGCHDDVDKKTEKCQDECNAEIYKRRDACKDLSWLPY